MNLILQKNQWLQLKIKFLWFLIFLFTISLKAQSPDYELRGYIKYLFSNTSFNQPEKNFSDHLLHARLNSKWFPSNDISAALETRFRMFYSQSLEGIPGYKSSVISDDDFFNLDYVLWDSKKTLGYIQIDRLYLDWFKGDFQLTAGRQRIAWGLSWVWNPLDIFNPLSVLDFDYEEHPGTDAIRLQFYTGPVSKIEAAFKPGKNSSDWTFGGLWTANAFDFDFNLLAGRKLDRWIAGFGWVGDILKAGFRGELTVSERPHLKLPDLVTDINDLQPIAESESHFITFVLSGDYTFPNSFYIHTEILYNNSGKTENTALFRNEANALGLLSPARWSVYQEFSYDITPLIRSGIFSIYNPSDKSYVFVPSVSYSVFTNLDFYMIALIFGGHKGTEFGDLGKSVFLRLKLSY